MIKLEYKPWEPDSTFDSMMGTPNVEELTMTLGDGVTWQEATTEFHNFLRAAGYVIPYDFEEEEPEKPEWVGLTKGEIQEIVDRIKVDDLLVKTSTWHIRFAKAVQRKLKELNT